MRVLPIACAPAVNEEGLPHVTATRTQHGKAAAPLETPEEDRWHYRGSGFVALQPRHLCGIYTLQRTPHSICDFPRVAHVWPLLTFAR